MATQSYDGTLNKFSLDLHGVLKRDAARVIHKRIEECSRYGISQLEVVYGTPDFFDGSIASALHEEVSRSPHVYKELLPREFLNECEAYSARIAKITVPLRAPASGFLHDAEMTFTGFPAARESDPWLRRSCENPYIPFKTTYSRSEAARFVGRGCRPDDIPGDALPLAELEELCREWTRPHPVSAVEAPAEPIGAVTPASETSIEDRWAKLWDEAAGQFSTRDFAAARRNLETCLSLAGCCTDTRFLGRTLGALSILSAAERDWDKSRAYLDSSNAAFGIVPDASQPSPETVSDRVHLALRTAEAMMVGGNLRGAIEVLSAVRQELDRDPDAFPAGRLDVHSMEAMLRMDLEDFPAAVGLLENALGIAAELPNLSPTVSAHLRSRLGAIDIRRGRLRQALKHFSHAAEEFDLDPRAAVDSYRSRRAIAAAAEQLNYFRPAEKLLRELIAIPATPGSLLAQMQTETRIDLGTLLFRRNLLTEAEAAYREAREASNPGTPSIARFDIAENLGNVYTHQGRFAEAEMEYEAAFVMARHLFPPQNPHIAQLYRNLGVLHMRAGRLPQSCEALDKALQIFSVAPGAAPDVAQAHLSRATLFAAAGNREEAEYHFRLALALQTEAYGEGDPGTAETLACLGHILREQGAYSQARPMLTRAIRILEDHRYNPGLLSQAYTSLHIVQTELGQEREAKKSGDKAVFYYQMAQEQNGKPN